MESSAPSLLYLILCCIESQKQANDHDDHQSTNLTVLHKISKYVVSYSGAVCCYSAWFGDRWI